MNDQEKRIPETRARENSETQPSPETLLSQYNTPPKIAYSKIQSTAVVLFCIAYLTADMILKFKLSEYNSVVPAALTGCLAATVGFYAGRAMAQDKFILTSMWLDLVSKFKSKHPDVDVDDIKEFDIGEQFDVDS